ESVLSCACVPSQGAARVDAHFFRTAFTGSSASRSISMNAQLMHVVCEGFPASRKVYQSGTLHPGLSVPVREIALNAAAQEPPLAVYDSSGPYTDPDVRIDIERGLPRMRAAWISGRGDVEAYPGRKVQLIDNGLSAGSRAAPEFPVRRAPLRAL